MKHSKNQNTITPAALSALRRGDDENFLAAITPGGIEAQEKRGQIDQSFAETLPIEGTEPGKNREMFEKLGFVFGNPTDGIFVQAKFPAGWRKQATSHSMWSNLLDDKGRKRGMIFYKAAFYDRSAHISLNVRFTRNRIMLDAKREEIFDRSTGEYANGKHGAQNVFDHFVVTDNATNEIAFDGEIVSRPDWSNRPEAEKIQAQADAAGEKCEQWLKQNYPDWKSPLAYWDEPAKGKE